MYNFINNSVYIYSMSTFQKLLTKSSYIKGLQCSKLLWIAVNQKERIIEIDQVRFDEGILVGSEAKKLFPDGIDISTENFKNNLEDSILLLKKGKPLFEAAFQSERTYSRADILEPSKECWNIIEVKSSTKVKDEHIQDVAFQKYCYEKVGLKINKCYLMHLNSKYIRKGKINLEELFIKEDISKKVEEEIKHIPKRVKEMLEIIDGKEPNVKIGNFCNIPRECPIMEECWKFLPENHVFELYRGNKQAMELFEKGILAIKDIPEDYELEDKHRIQRYCVKNNKPHVNKKELTNFIEKLKYPLYFLDFETYQSAIPIYDDLSPYQQIPFQFSLHVVDEDNKKEHFSFIAESNKDPRKEFLKELKKVLGKKGSIIVYNQSFEQGRIKELAELFPKNKKWAESVTKRMVDLLIPFRNFYYYDCKQKGSCSIKHVLPALTKKTYEGMEIDNGGLASIRYLYIIHGDKHGKKASAEEVKKVREDLEKYCGLDTEAMVDVLDVLRKV